MNNHTLHRPQLIADGVIAGYIHDISVRHRRGDAVSTRAQSRHGSGRVRRLAPKRSLGRLERDLVDADATRAGACDATAVG
jgi:hypothetical protein